MCGHWVGTWTATPAPAEGISLSAPTIRMFPRISIGGDTIRVRLLNTAGTSDLVLDPRGATWRGHSCNPPRRCPVYRSQSRGLMQEGGLLSIEQRKIDDIAHAR